MGKKVLIVEDERPLAKALELALKRDGYDVVVVHDGQAALDLLQEQIFDVMLLDVLMPTMDGLELLGQLSKLSKKPSKIIALSNLSRPGNMQDILDAGAQKFLVKASTSLEDVVKEVKDMA